MAILTKPEMTEKRIAEVQEVVAQNPGMTRSQLSILICDLWEWCSPTGQRKDIAAREMLRGLDKAGLIKLPPPKNLNQSSGCSRSVIHLTHDMSLIECELSDLMPLQMHIPVGGNELAEFKSYISQFHYLGIDRMVGENMKYVIKAKDGRPLACMLFGSAAWSCRDRDNYIGWDKNARRQNLYMLTGNTRFLIFPWIRVPFLASKILSMAIRRLSSDWETRYGHPLAAVETFVERRRFRGVCYKAANWLYVGSTTGRGRDGGHKHAILPEKDIYIYLLDRRRFERLKEICP